MTKTMRQLPLVLSVTLQLTGVSAWAPQLPPPMVNSPSVQVIQNQHRQTAPTTMSDHIGDWFSNQGQVVNELVGIPPAYAAEGETGPPTKDEILTLQKAFAAFYGAQRDPQAALPLLDESVKSFQRQPPDERAGLYRVRGDCKMALKNPTEAVEDYTTAIDLLRLPESKNKADPIELPASM